MARETETRAASDLDALAYEHLVEELEAVVKQLEAGDLPLEDSLRAFERGVLLSQAAEGRLDAAEHRVEVLLQGDRVGALPGQESSAAPGAKIPGDEDDLPF